MGEKGRLRPRRADHGPAPRRRRAVAWAAGPARRRRQVGHRHRAPPGGYGARRLDHRPRSRRRQRRRPDRFEHARRPRRRALHPHRRTSRATSADKTYGGPPAALSAASRSSNSRSERGRPLANVQRCVSRRRRRRAHWLTWRRPQVPDRPRRSAPRSRCETRRRPGEVAHCLLDVVGRPSSGLARREFVRVLLGCQARSLDQHLQVAGVDELVGSANECGIA